MVYLVNASSYDSGRGVYGKSLTISNKTLRNTGFYNNNQYFMTQTKYKHYIFSEILAFMGQNTMKQRIQGEPKKCPISNNGIDNKNQN